MYAEKIDEDFLETPENHLKDVSDIDGNVEEEASGVRNSIIYSWSTYNDITTEKIRYFGSSYKRFHFNTHKDGEIETKTADNLKLETADGNKLVASVVTIIIITVIIT